MKINIRYLPHRLTSKDRLQQGQELLKSQTLYKKGIYHRRLPVHSFTSKPSKHVKKAIDLYKVDKIGATDELAVATGCKKDALAQIIRKGEGAYYSSGSRPNQTGQSWGIARLASAITAGKSSYIDFSILEKGCNKTSKALRLAKNMRKTYKKKMKRSMPKVKI